VSHRNIIEPYKIFDNADMSANINQGLPYTTIDKIDRISIDLDWTGTAPVGELIVEVSYLIPRTTDYTPWRPLDFGSTIDITGNTGNHQIVIQDPPFQKIRISYVATSGTGNLTAVFYAMSKGA